MPWRHRGRVQYNSTLSLTLVLNGDWEVNATPRPLYSRELPGIYIVGGWVGPVARLDGCAKSQPLPVFDPRTVRPIASRYPGPCVTFLTFFKLRYLDTGAVRASFSYCGLVRKLPSSFSSILHPLHSVMEEMYVSEKPDCIIFPWPVHGFTVIDLCLWLLDVWCFGIAKYKS